jgi:hypothetical protein
MQIALRLPQQGQLDLMWYPVLLIVFLKLLGDLRHI